VIAVVVIVWLLCAVLCVLIAGSKGLPVGPFVVLGLLLGVIGVVLALLARPAGAVYQMRVRCPGCSKSTQAMSDDLTFDCPHCGAHYEVPAAA
jgi:hypothetical protein